MTSSPVTGGPDRPGVPGASVGGQDDPFAASWGAGLAWLRPTVAADVRPDLVVGGPAPGADHLRPDLAGGGPGPAAGHVRADLAGGGPGPVAGHVRAALAGGGPEPVAHPPRRDLAGGGPGPVAGGGDPRPAAAGLLVGDGAVVLSGGVATWLPEGRWVAADDVPPGPAPGGDSADGRVGSGRRGRRGGGRAGAGRAARRAGAGRRGTRTSGRAGAGGAARGGRTQPGARSRADLVTGRVAFARWAARLAGWPRRVLVVALLAAAVLLGLRPDPPLPPLAPAVPGTAVVVTARDLPAGRVLATADLRTVRMPAAVAPAHAVAVAATLVGRVVAGPMRRGEAVTDARVVGPGLTAGLAAGEAAAVPVRLADPETAALVRPGDRIDVLGTPVEPDGGRSPSGPDAVAVASGVRVLAVLGALDAADGVVVVVAAPERVARRLAGGAGRHRLTVAVRPP